MLHDSTPFDVSAAAKGPPRDAEVVVVLVHGNLPLGDAGPAGEAVAVASRAGVVADKKRDASAFTYADGRLGLAVCVGSEVTAQTVAEACGVAARQRALEGKRRVALVAPPGFAEAATMGLLLGGYRYTELFGARRREEARRPRARLTVVADDADAVARGEHVARAQNLARTVACRPGNVVDPPALVDLAADLAKAHKSVTSRALDEKELKRLGMGGLLAVGAAGSAPPRLVVLEHKPKGVSADAPPLLVVGKAITFDTGGISIKPAEKMGAMIFDKSGGCAVLGLFDALGRLNVRRRVVGLLAAAENMPGERAYRPGDVIRHYSGVTCEVTNTDAEGRLVLADALAWGIEQYAPSAVVDLATLTGGAVVALGHAYAAAFCNDDALFARVAAAGQVAHEKLWRMPLDDAYVEMMRSSSADAVNSAGRQASPCTGAAFLSLFAKRPGEADTHVPWCHLDIAGVADTEKELPLYGRGGATGWGVRTLLALAEGEAS